jgi:hypothetical protein
MNLQRLVESTGFKVALVWIFLCCTIYAVLGAAKHWFGFSWWVAMGVVLVLGIGFVLRKLRGNSGRH